MKLEDEALLVDFFINRTKKNKNSISLTEVETSYGRPDVIEIFINNNIFKKRKKVAYSNEFSNEMSFTMAYLYNKSWVKLETLQKFLGIYDRKFQRLIEDLYERQLIDVKDNTYIKSKPYKELMAIKRIIAYEAKLFKWKDAVEQAERHLWFTKESYIIIPEKSNRTNVLIEERCKRNNVGLIYLNNKGNFDTKIKSLNKGVVNSTFVWKLNESLIQEGNYE